MMNVQPTRTAKIPGYPITKEHIDCEINKKEKNLRKKTTHQEETENLSQWN